MNYQSQFGEVAEKVTTVILSKPCGHKSAMPAHVKIDANVHVPNQHKQISHTHTHATSNHQQQTKEN